MEISLVILVLMESSRKPIKEASMLPTKKQTLPFRKRKLLQIESYQKPNQRLIKFFLKLKQAMKKSNKKRSEKRRINILS